MTGGEVVTLQKYSVSPTCEVRTVPTIWLADGQAYLENFMRYVSRYWVTDSENVTKNTVYQGRVGHWTLIGLHYLSFFKLQYMGNWELRMLLVKLSKRDLKMHQHFCVDRARCLNQKQAVCWDCTLRSFSYNFRKLASFAMIVSL